jgi:glycosyltransferase involved in cell wall biosynthesis
MRIAVSCRSLAGTRFHPESLHLHDLIDIWQSAGHEVILIGPSDAVERLPGDTRRVRLDPEHSLRSRVLSIIWGEARAAAEAGAHVLFIPESIAPLMARLPIAVTISRRRTRPASFSRRIQIAAGQAGLGGASVVLMPNDLPAPVADTRLVRRLPAFVGPAFTDEPIDSDADRLRELELTSGYALAFGGSEDEVRALLAAWSWVAGALGDDYRLVIAGGGGVTGELSRTIAAAADLSGPLRWIDDVSAGALPALFRGADVFLHAGPTSTGQELRWALACGVPIAGVETPDTAAVVADAGYLVPSLDTRALGAACLTAIVDEDVAGKLKERSLARARAYHEPASRLAWAEVLQSILSPADRERRP